jgi:anti-sigma B factor antagonist
VPQADADLVVTLQASPAGPCLITVSGELDYHTGPRLRAYLDEAPLRPGAALVLDLSGLTHCDSIGVAVLVHGYRRAEAAGATAALAGTPAGTFRLLCLTGLDRLFSSYDSVDAAIAALLPGRAGRGQPVHGFGCPGSILACRPDAETEVPHTCVGNASWSAAHCCQ